MTSSRAFLIRNALILGLLAMCVFFMTQTDSFATVGNLKNIATNSSILAVAAVAATLLIISGYVDLSVGSTVGLAGTMTGLAVASWGWGAPAAIVLGVLVGAAVGAINGVLCAQLGLSAIIVTLGMLGAIRGITLLISDKNEFGLGGTFDTLGAGSVIGIPWLAVVAAVFFLAGGLFLRFTPWGRHVYAIGVNPRAAYLTGLPVRALPLMLFVAAGASAGVAGVLFTSRLGGTSPSDMGVGLEIQVLTVILLGGVTFTGGRGSLLGVFIAAVFLGVLANGLVLMNVTPYVQQVAQGAALVVAAGLDQASSRVGDSALWRTGVERQLDALRDDSPPAPEPDAVQLEKRN
jgi:ribose/xylose/arabinose/galactoside ABC-type transport system permease subunit